MNLLKQILPVGFATAKQMSHITHPITSVWSSTSTGAERQCKNGCILSTFIYSTAAPWSWIEHQCTTKQGPGITPGRTLGSLRLPEKKWVLREPEISVAESTRRSGRKILCVCPQPSWHLPHCWSPRDSGILEKLWLWCAAIGRFDGGPTAPRLWVRSRATVVQVMTGQDPRSSALAEAPFPFPS